MHNKYHDVLVAWAEGRPVQVRQGTDPWITVDTEHCQCLDFSSGGTDPRFRIEWRVKPEDPWYRVALMCRGDLFYTTSADNWAQEDNIMNSYFVRWLTDRISYEV